MGVDRTPPKIGNTQNETLDQGSQHMVMMEPTSAGTYVLSGTAMEFSYDPKTGNYVLIEKGSEEGPKDDKNEVQGQDDGGMVGQQQVMQPAIVGVGSSIGSIKTFVHGDDWKIHKERLEHYFLANYVEDTRKASVLLTALDWKVYKTVSDLCHPSTPSGKTYEQLCKIMKSHFSPRVAVFRERKNFYELRQKPDETESQWYARVKEGAVLCEFGGELDGRIKDKFITAMKEGRVLERVLEESHTSSLQTLVEVAKKRESALQHMQTSHHTHVHRITRQAAHAAGKESAQNGSRQPTHGGSRMSSEAQRNDQSRQQRQQQQQHYQRQQQRRGCSRCGHGSHAESNCKYKNTKCHKCGKLGHLEKMCRNKNFGNDSNGVKNNFLEEKSIDYIGINNVKEILGNEKMPPIVVDVEIKGTKIAMEIDSGAGVSVMPYNVYKELLSNDVKIVDCSKVLITYSDEKLSSLGEIRVNAKCNQREIGAKFIIVESNTKKMPLLGRDLMKKFGFVVKSIDECDEIKNMQTTDQDISKLVEDFAVLFDGKLGKYNKGKLSIEFQEKDVKPIYRKPHTIPFALRSKVKDELDRLEKVGIIKKSEKVEWGTPIVPVLKSDGGIRLCANYKVTVNPFLKDYNYPIPREEEMFVALEGG